MTSHVEPLLVTWLAARFPGVRVCTETPANLAEVVPCIQVVGIGGSGDRLQFDSPRVDCDVYDAAHDQASARENARTLAQQVRDALLQELPGQSVGDAFVLSVDEFMSPTWTPYDNTVLRRFTLSVGLRLHTRSAV
ncbi:hypothetical protein [Nocardioides terrisoli]|uniref:hypothetical protein n=1 Tax=Nocardioides terrisoli TaxID=3388267 RepID=UPI00287B89B6|nr:hypothetical protein [Nocardioides marmorisolisilvae]